MVRDTDMTDDKPEPQDDTLLAYSEGRLSRRDAIERLGLQDSADLLVALGDAGLEDGVAKTRPACLLASPDPPL